MKTESHRMRAVLSMLLIFGMLLAVPGVPLASASVSELAPAFAPNANDLRISQVYGGGGNTGATYTNDFIELFNAGSTTINLTGYSVQYASATGSTWQVTNLAGSIGPGHYYLIQEAQGSGGTTPLPTPDAVGTIPMSGTAGKVALVNTTTAQTVSCPAGAQIIDFVGFGATANCYEGSGPTPAPSNTNAVLRASNGCTDTDNNAADFAASLPTPRNTASPINVCGGGDLPPTVTSTTPDDNAVEVAVDVPVSVTFSENVTFAGTVNIVCTGGTQTVTPTGGPLTFNLPHTDFALSDACSITILANQVTDQDGTPTPMAADYTWGFEVASGCSEPATLIHDIQGSGLTSPLVGQAHTVEATVTADFQGQSSIRGFFLTEDSEDADPATSEGLFIYDNNFGVDVSIGNLVRVSGFVSEFQDQTQLSSISSVLVCPNNMGVWYGNMTLPFPTTTYPERFEGMSVFLTQTLTVNETYNLGRGGILTLSNGRLQQPTNVVLPGAPANALQAANNLNQITLDDGSLVQNPDPIIYPPPQLTALNTVRSGDTVVGTIGVLTQGNPGWTTPGNIYRIYPGFFGPPTFTATNPRPAAPDPVRANGSLRVSSFNVLNYFLTLDVTNTPPFPCGPSQNQECRGANTAQEFTRQRDKLLQALNTLNADVVGLMELENTPGVEPLQDIVNGLNALTSPGTYAFINPGTILPGDHVIKVGLIYKPAVVRPIGNFALLDISVNPNFNTALNRPALAQTFEEIATGGRFTVIVNHLKSKGCTGATGLDTDQNDGQSCFNYTRTLAANALAAWAASDPTGMGDPDVLMMGDLNAYSREDPIRALETAGYTELEVNFEGPNAYSYVFSSQAGSLDHSMANASLLPQVNDATTWHINADEPIVLDYNVEFKSANQLSLLYNADAYRTSDHDPLLIGLNLTPSEADLWVSKVGEPDPVGIGDTLVYTITTQNNGPDLALDVTITDTLPAGVSFNGAAAYTGTCSEAGGVVTCDMGDMADGVIQTVVISGTVAGVSCGDVLTNTVEVASSTPDNQPNNNVDEEPTTVGCVPPNIDVSPASISSSQEPNIQTQHTLTISNTGQAGLAWEIFEKPVSAPAAFPVTPALARRFDSQTTLDAEMSGLELTSPAALPPADPVAHAYAKRLLLSTGLLLIPDSTNDRIMAFDPVTGNLIDPDFVPSNAVMATAINAILNASGDGILVSDQINDVVHEFDLDGNYLGVFAPAGGVNNAILDNIRGISLRPNGNLLVTVASGANTNSVAEFDTSGNYLGNFIAAASGGLGSPWDPYPRGSDWLVSGSGGTTGILSYDLSGAFLNVVTPISSFPEQIDEAANSNVLAANFSPTANEGVLEYTSTGTFVGRYDPTGLTGYRGVYELPGGTILTTTGTGVHEIDRNGTLVQSKITGVSGRFIEYVVLQSECEDPADIPWAAVSPISGTLPGGQASDVTVTLDSTGLTPGTYTGRLCVTSNDPDPGPGNGTDLVVVPLTLTVEAPPVPAIALAKTVGTDPTDCATTDEIAVPAGTEVTYCYEVSNTGNVTLNYHDLEDSELGVLLSGQVYTLAPGASTFVTQTTTINATTVNTATWTAYNPNYVNLVTATDTATVTVGIPNIDVNPLSLSQTHPTPQVTTLPLTVANTGAGTLTWAIVEEPAGVTPAPLTGGDAAVARDVVDLSGANGPVQPQAPAPLSDWRAPEAVLYDNGPLVTNPGAGFGGADASVLQTSLGLNTLGFGNQVSAGNRVADDFTVPAGGWQINTITFFGYQTGSTTASTFTDLNLRIWDGPPNNPASQVVFGDTTTNRLASSTWTNMYRVSDTTPLGNTRPVMANVATVNTFLPAGTYWLDWAAGGSLASGPWAPPVSILGQTGKPGANALQYTSAGWASLIDAGPAGTSNFPQDLPFIVDGTAAADCSNPSDVPWLSETPTSGSTPGGGSTPVTVSFDSTGLTPGTYTANLCITSNDPDAGPGNGTDLVVVPVTLTLNSPTAVTLSGLAAGQAAAPAPLSVPVGVVMLGIAAAAVWLRRR